MIMTGPEREEFDRLLEAYQADTLTNGELTRFTEILASVRCDPKAPRVDKMAASILIHAIEQGVR